MLDSALQERSTGVLHDHKCLLMLCGRLAGLVLTLGLFPAAVVWAQSSVLEVQPSSISASNSYSEIKARVVLKSATQAIRKPVLSWLSNDGLEVEIGSPSMKMAAVGQEIVWTATIKNFNHTRLPSTLLFEAQYLTSGPAAHHVFATLPLNSAGDASFKPFEASLEGSFDAVSEQRPASAYLLVTNNLPVLIHVTIKAFFPKEIFTLPAPPAFDVAPHSATQQKVELKAESRVTPGTYPIVFAVTAQWEMAGAKEQRQILVSKTATAGVFFESELLKLLGVPSFLVLPGCLVLFTMQLFLTWGILGLKNDSRLPQLTLTSPGFWIIAVSFSGMFAWAYAWITGVNYLLYYGVVDLRNVWLVSILIGALAYLAYGAATKKNRREHVPTSEDDPISLLKKMEKNKLKVTIPTVSFKVGDAELVGCVVEHIEEGQQLVWIAPQISVTWKSNDAEDKFKTTLDQGSKKTLDQMDAVEQLRDAVARNYAGVDWAEQDGWIPRPIHLKIDAITRFGEVKRILAT